VIDAFHSEVEQVVDHQHLGFAALEAARVDDAGDDDGKSVDAVYPGYRYEDSVARKQLDHKPLYSWGIPGGATLHNHVAHLAYLIPSTVKDWQAPDA
jgi:hypothetical protein